MSVFPLKLSPHSRQKELWPQSGNHILAQFDDTSIIVYQAYNATIAEQIVKHQNFHSEPVLKSGFNMNRMTWIKTNFLWMMYRSGWATKQNQQRILAIRITRSGFEQILSKAVLFRRSTTEANKTDEVRLQWDPDHEPNGDKVVRGRRAIQLGLRGNMLCRFSESFIISVDDITEFVTSVREYISRESELIIPEERVYTVTDEEIVKRIQLS